MTIEIAERTIVKRPATQLAIIADTLAREGSHLYRAGNFLTHKTKLYNSLGDQSVALSKKVRELSFKLAKQKKR